MAGNTVFRDMTMLALLGFVAMVLMMIAHLNPPTREADARPAGNVVVEITWPDSAPSDVDLWVRAPGDNSVGYSAKSGRVFNLLRDDLGLTNDTTPANYEFAISRGAPPGEYTVNVHLYAVHRVPLPLHVSVRVTLHREGKPPLIIAKRQVSLVRKGQEVTAARFEIDAAGAFVAGSLHDLPKPLRAVGGGP